MSDMDENGSSNNVLISLSLSMDKDRFLRRTCPSCGQDFKTETEEADIVWLLAPQIRRMGLEIGGVEEKNSGHDNYLYCPYCEQRSEATNTLTEETVNYTHRHLMREIVLPMTNKAFSGFNDLGKSTGGLFSINFEYSRGTLPPRPIHGPEPCDMIEVDFLCCGRKAKVIESWVSLKICIFCGKRIELA
ncbi:MAG: hypothetical protein SWO11_07410 [Thermodesulfobacteriota bacterium]|nr:hypothetical protein [Thermodesulfobacteriota bacterium]